MIVWVSNQNKNLNDSYEIYLWAKNFQTKIITEQNYIKANDEFLKFQDEWKNFSLENDIKTYLEKTLNSSNLVLENLKNTSEMLKNSISTSTFSQSTIDSLILTIESDINSLNSFIQKIILDNQNIDLAKLSLETKTTNQNNTISSLESQVEQAKIVLEKTNLQSKTTIDDLNLKYSQALVNLSWAQTKLQNNIDLANSQINISKANLDNKVSNFDNRELKPYYTAIENAKVWIYEAKQRLIDATLISPINWKIWKLSVQKVWSIISQNSIEPFAILINKDSLYIEAKIEEWDISNIFLNQDVKLTFNSIDNLELTWKVSYISDKAETDVNWIVTYKVEVLFDKIDKKVKEWFTTQIYFILSKIKNTPSLPIEAVKTQNEISTVILKDNSVKTVKIWISDWNFVQILEWLKLWDVVKY